MNLFQLLAPMNLNKKWMDKEKAEKKIKIKK